ncbi:IS5/IS1182 family transposase domain protein [Rickettsiales endosymbiont of Paramecium tredecaurelia]|nr:IS5/IS1182 family transposase domain protein [Candidatus Sarmatiella mevalonica]
MIRYSKIAKHPRVFLRLFGMELEKFEIIIKKLEKIWDKRVVGQYKRPGRNYKLGLEEMTLMLLIDLFPNSTPDGNCFVAPMLESSRTSCTLRLCALYTPRICS